MNILHIYTYCAHIYSNIILFINITTNLNTFKTVFTFSRPKSITNRTANYIIMYINLQITYKSFSSPLHFLPTFSGRPS